MTRNPFHTVHTVAAACLLLSAGPLAAQEEPQPAAMAAYMEAGTPNEHHAALAAMAGRWTAEVRMFMDPTSDQPMMSEASVEGEMIMDGRFYRETMHGAFMGMPFRGELVCGYNNVTGEYEATWIDSFSTAVGRYTGSMEGDVLTLEGGFQDPTTGEWVTSRSVRTVSHDRMVDIGFETRDGQERKVMEITYTRKM